MLYCPLVETGYNESDRAAQRQTGWIFELDGHGTVLHSRAFPGTNAKSAAAETSGFNFFEDLEGFDEMPTLKQRFRSFVTGTKATDTFCLSAPGTGETKVLFTKAFQTGTLPPSPLVMMEIRKGQLPNTWEGTNGNTTFKLRK